MEKRTFKTVTLALVFLLAACGSYTFSTSSRTAAKYKISDADVQKWIVEKNKVEQCLYPKERKTKGTKLSEGERQLYHLAVYQRTLSQVIGASHYLTLIQNPASQQYLAKKLQQFGHSRTAQFTKSWCNDLKADYLQAVQAMKAVNKKSLTANDSAKQNAKSTKANKKQQLGNTAREQQILSREAQEQDMPQEAVTQDTQDVGKESSYQHPQAPSDRIRVSWEPVRNEVYSY